MAQGSQHQRGIVNLGCGYVWEQTCGFKFSRTFFSPFIFPASFSARATFPIETWGEGRNCRLISSSYPEGVAFRISIQFLNRFLPVWALGFDFFLLVLWVLQKWSSRTRLTSGLRTKLALMLLVQGLVNSFCKVPDSKYFRLCGTYVFCPNYSTQPL